MNAKNKSGNYCNDLIILASTYMHAVTLYISKEKKVYNVAFINSGKGVDNHDQYDNDHKILYNLWKTYEFSQSEYDKFIMLFISFQGVLWRK